MPEKKKKNTRKVPINKKPVVKGKNKNINNANNTKNKSKNKTKTKQIVIKVLIVLLVLFLVACGIIAGVIFGIFQKYKLPDGLLGMNYENTVILDTDGNVIATLNATEKRESIKIEEMSPYIPIAFVAIEDERFYEHQGIDIKRTAAATFKYIFTGNSSFGGSTITQQLVKNLTDEDTRDATRKIKEMARAYNLEKTKTKDDILELYLNTIFMGGDAFGVQVASKLYFNKSASELDLAESAFLAGINNSPNAYKPFEDSDEMRQKIKSRTLTVINKMHDLGKINEEEYNTAVEKVNNGLTFTKGNISANNYSYHTDALIAQVIKDIQEANPDMSYDTAEFYLYNSGLTIYSTQVSSIQNIVEQEYKNPSYLYKSSKNYIKDSEGNYTDVRATTQSAMVIIDHKTGQVVACVGGLGEKTARGLNRATQAVKQPGSSIKPLAVIAPSLEKGLITAATVVDDTPVTYGNWSPKNDTGGFYGLMTIKNIIRVSRNIPEVKMMSNLGPENSIEFLKKLGITTVDENDANLSTALGGLTRGVIPLEMAAAYAAIANDGVYIEPKFYTKIEDANGNVVLEANPEIRTVMSADNAYILKTILREPLKAGGTAGNAYVPNMDVCAKTGTTDNQHERWLCGFTPYYTAATWFGFDESEKIPNGGVNTAMTIWGKVMRSVHSGLESKSFKPTGNITTARVCSKSGLLAVDGLCDGCTYVEEFVKGTVPTKSCTTHVKEKVCLQEDETYKKATEFCPNAEERVFITRPNSDTDRSWEKAGDASQMLPEETCSVHTEPEVPSTTEPTPEPSTTPSPVVPSTSPSPQQSPSPTVSTSPSVAPSIEPSVEPSKEPGNTQNGDGTTSD